VYRKLDLDLIMIKAAKDLLRFRSPAPPDCA